MATEKIVYRPIPELNKQGLNAVLCMTTMKAMRGGLASCASIVFQDPQTGNVSFEMFGDYRKNLLWDRTARATAKNIDAHHNRVFTDTGIAEQVQAAKAFYRS